MNTPPFGDVLEAAIKDNVQGGKLYVCAGRSIVPRFFCCMSGNAVGVNKTPVARLHVTPTKACANTDTVTANYSQSYSPTSTIASYEVDWGDGSTTGAQVWPGPGFVTHVYTLPGTYYIVLTVTDMLGAHNEDVVEVTIIDCTAPEGEAFAGCGASGAWHTRNGGLDWDPIGLDGIVVHDLKVSPFTVDSSLRLLWAATEDGLYRGYHNRDARTASWERITLPIPGGGTHEPDVSSVLPSSYDVREMYALAYQTTPDRRVWLARTVDAGETWDYIQLGTPSFAVEIDWGVAVISAWHGIAEYKGSVYCASFGGGSSRVYRRNTVTRTWSAIAPNPVMYTAHIINSGGYLYCAGRATALNPSLQRWTGTAWQSSGTLGKIYDDICALVDGRICCAEAQTVDIYSGLVLVDTTPAIPLAGVIRTIGNAGNTLLAFTTNGRIYRYWLGAWVLEASGYTDFRGHPVVYEGKVYAATANDSHRVIVRSGGGFWSDDDDQPPQMLNGLFVTTEGADRFMSGSSGYICERRDDQWFVVSYGVLVSAVTVFYDGFANDLLFSHLDGVSMLRVGEGKIPLAGRTHLVAASVNALYVYVALLTGLDVPLILRVPYDLSSVDFIRNPGVGTWGGVATDYNNSRRVWAFGDFDVVKVQVSDDQGDTWDDRTDGGWAGEVVRPILPSIYNSNNVVAILNDALDAYYSLDCGQSWVKTGDTPFPCHCAARDYIDDQIMLVGRLNAGALHLQLSTNLGASWAERSGGFTPNAPVTALQIVG